MTLIAPSFLAADFLNLQREVDLVNKYADLCHMDVMDGIFVPNISFGFPVVRAVASASQKILDVHLMIADPQKYALEFAAIENVGMVSFHLETVPQPEQLLDRVRQCGVKAGLVINPDCPVQRLFPFLDHCDFVLLMSVFAGFGGQKFIENTIDRVKELKSEISRRHLDVMIEVDGGINESNAHKIVLAGADILVAGTAVFRAENPAQVIAAMR